MITRSRRSLEKISYERSPLPCSRVIHGFQGHSKDVPTVCSMTIGTRPFALGDDQSEARGCDSREPLKSEKCLLQFREASRVGRLRVASERNMTGRRIQVSPSLDSRHKLDASWKDHVILISTRTRDDAGSNAFPPSHSLHPLQ